MNSPDKKTIARYYFYSEIQPHIKDGRLLYFDIVKDIKKTGIISIMAFELRENQEHITHYDLVYFAKKYKLDIDKNIAKWL